MKSKAECDKMYNFICNRLESNCLWSPIEQIVTKKLLQVFLLIYVSIVLREKIKLL